MGESNRRFDVENDSFTPSSSGNMLDLGVTSTDEVLSRELNNFLTSDDTGVVDSDPKDIKPIEEKDKDGEEKPKETVEDVQKSLKTGLSDYLHDEDEDDEDEDEKPTKEAPKEKEQPKKEKEKVDTSNVYTNLSKDLYDLGVFNHDDEEEDDDPITTPEEFLEKFNGEKIKQANEFINNFLGRFGDEYREAFESIFLRGVSPQEYYSAQAKMDSIRDIDLKDVNSQKKVFIEYYRRQGLSQEKIDKKLDRAIEMELLEDEANDLHEILLEQESKNIEQMEEEKARELHRKQLDDQKYAHSISHILSAKLKEKEFDGIPLTPKDAEEAADYMITKKWKLPSGELLSDFDKDLLELKYPDNYELRVKMALLLKKRGDLSKIKQKAISKKSEEIFTNTATLEKVQKRKDPFSNTTNTSFFD